MKKYKQFISEDRESIKGGKSSGKNIHDLAIKHSYDDSKDSVSKEEIQKMEDILKKELEMGMKIEMEHTEDPDIAKEIAMDHLDEDPHYYKKIKKLGL